MFISRTSWRITCERFPTTSLPICFRREIQCKMLAGLQASCIPRIPGEEDGPRSPRSPSGWSSAGCLLAVCVQVTLNRTCRSSPPSPLLHFICGEECRLPHSLGWHVCPLPLLSCRTLVTHFRYLLQYPMRPADRPSSTPLAVKVCM